MVGVAKRMNPSEGSRRNGNDGFVGDSYGASSSPRTTSYSDGTNPQTSWAMNFT